MVGSESKLKSLRYSFLDGIFASGMIGFVQDYFTPFIILLGATSRQIGILNALPNFFSSLFQLKSAELVERFRSRKTVFTINVFLQALMLLPIVFIALKRISAPIIFIIFVVLFNCFGALAMPAWSSLMSDLVDKDKRGEYFGWRNKNLGLVTIASTLLAGLILQRMQRFDVYYGFAILFGFSFCFRIISWYFLTKMHEPEFKLNKDDQFTFLEFIARIKESNFAKFVLFVSLMNFSVNLAAPFFSVLMLRELGFSYILYTIITVTATLTANLTISRWGRISDTVGNLRIIRLVSPVIGILPFLWIINRNPIFLICIQIISGFAWAGFNLCSLNFIYDAVISEKRTRCIAYFNVLNGLALCFGALTGGFLLHRLPPLFGYRILMLFLISTLLRLIVSIIIPKRLKEVKPVKEINAARIFFSMIGIRPLIEFER